MSYIDFLREPLQALSSLNHPNYNDFYHFYQTMLENANIASPFASTLSRFLFLPPVNNQVSLNISEEGQFVIVDVLNLANNSQFIANIINQGNARQSPLMMDLTDIVNEYGFLSSSYVQQYLGNLSREQKVELMAKLFSRIAQERPENKFILVVGFRNRSGSISTKESEFFRNNRQVNLVLPSEEQIAGVPPPTEVSTYNLSNHANIKFPNEEINLSIIFGTSVVSHGGASMEADDLLSIYLLTLITNYDEKKAVIMTGDRFSFLNSEDEYWNNFLDQYKAYLVYNGLHPWRFLTGIEYYHPSLIRVGWR